MFIPNLIIFQFVVDTPILIIISILLFIILYHYAYLLKINTHLTVPAFQDKSKLMLIVGVAVLLLVPFFIRFGININFDAFYLKNMYALRESSVQNSNVFIAYFYPWLVKVILPIGMIITLRYKKYLLTLVFVVFQIYLYSIQPQKSVFISIFLLFFYFFNNQEKQLRTFLLLIFVLLSVSELISFTTGGFTLQSIFSRRVFFVPAILNNCYFDFFKDNHLYLSHSIFKYYIDYPFSLSPDHMIGKVYYGQPKMASNNGFISDGFMNFGFPGILLNIVGLIFILKTIKSIRISHIYYGVILILIFAFISSYFLTTLLTHGVLLFIFISFFILHNTQKA
jgi:hypothetical protein